MIKPIGRRVALLAGLAAAAAARGQAVRDPDQHFFQPLLGDLKQELQVARTEGRRGVLLVYEMEGCPFCARFRKSVLREAAVQDWYRRHFAVFRIDIRGSNPVVAFDGREMTESAFARAQKVRATPTAVFYGLDGQEQVRFAGTARDAREFLQLGEFVLSGAWRRAGFDEYKARKP